MKKVYTLKQITEILELPEDRFHYKKGMSIEETRHQLASFKSMIRYHRKNLAKKYHPDKPGGSEDRMKQINAVVDQLLEIEIKVARPRPVHIRYYSYSVHGYSGYNSTSTSGF